MQSLEWALLSCGRIQCVFDRNEQPYFRGLEKSPRQPQSQSQTQAFSPPSTFELNPAREGTTSICSPAPVNRFWHHLLESRSRKGLETNSSDGKVFAVRTRRRLKEISRLWV